MVKIAPNITPMLVFTTGYLSIFFILMGLMPMLAPNLLYGGKDYTNYKIPEYFSKFDIENIKYFEDNNLTYPQSAIYYDYNPDINVKLFAEWTVANPYITLDVITWEWWVFWTAEDLYFTDINSTDVIDEMYIGKPELLLAWSDEFNSSIFTATAPSGIITVKCWFADNDTDRNNIGEAFDDGTISLGVGFGLDDVETSYNAFNLIGLLLTFQQPHVFGASGVIALALNGIINLAMFLSIAYLVYYFVTSIIPFIRGA